ncbi:MAG TPA: DUF1801 domain-containing protein [Saprospiraceae bacterium]|nr:DUF1801 domain-containing protein [Saprospiraceae bacterium]HRO07369.1 DUF1801 domain-containing protein [Saprospiraceae bacterium]HRP40652.1 DUF1801 domain-containing protein [Saprospiraceae bacterium]
MHQEIIAYNQGLEEKDICNLLAQIIHSNLPNAESKIWHTHPIWFLEDNPIVGYSKQKKGIRLMFWSGADFDEEGLSVRGEKFKDASVFYTNVEEINEAEIKRWLEKSIHIQWDYKNLIKRKGKLERLK